MWSRARARTIVDDEPAPNQGVAARAGPDPPREASPPLPHVAGSDVRRRGPGDDGHGGPRRVERQGQAGAGLDAGPPHLTTGLRGDLHGDGEAGALRAHASNSRSARWRAASATAWWSACRG